MVGRDWPGRRGGGAAEAQDLGLLVGEAVEHAGVHVDGFAGRRGGGRVLGEKGRAGLARFKGLGAVDALEVVEDASPGRLFEGDHVVGELVLALLPVLDVLLPGPLVGVAHELEGAVRGVGEVHDDDEAFVVEEFGLGCPRRVACRPHASASCSLRGSGRCGSPGGGRWSPSRLLRSR